MEPETLALIGIRTGLLAYVALSVFFVIGWRRRISGRAALLGASVTALWFLALATLGPRPVVSLLEVTAYSAWIVLLARVLGWGPETMGMQERSGQGLLFGAAAALYAASLAFFVLAPDALGEAYLQGVRPIGAYFKLGMCLLGLVAVEQVFRNTRSDGHWNLKFLCVGLGVIFGYGFVLHADEAMFRSTSFALFAAQGVVVAAATPFLAVASMRSRHGHLRLNLSRRFVFRTGMLVAAGVYLLVMGTAGYYVRLFGGEWGQVVQVMVVSAGLIGLLVLLLSTSVRNRLRVTLLRNLYEYKYDYRDEWLRVTRALTDTHADESLARRAVLALGEVVHTTTGRCYRMSGQSILLPMTESTGGLHTPLTPATSASLESFCKVRNWIIDLDEYRTARGAYESLDLDADLPALANDRFIVPLLVEDHLFGIVVLGRPNTPIELIWEDYDILKVIARQAAAFLALQHADAELAASEQLRAMHQISAFVVHDLKTIAAQLSLLLENAPRHRTNPAFIDDMLRTTANAVARMQKLLAQLRDAQATGPGAGCRLDDVASTAIARRVAQLPAPQLAGAACKAEVAADRERLLDVVTHIIQNAQDATPRYGTVTVELGLDRTWATLAVRDSGSGMTREFVEQSLFVPFATTKGVSGIGIGAYQSREYLRSIGGDLTVRTEAGKGSEFVLRIPLLASQRAEPQAAMSASS